MAQGPGKYDEACTAARESTEGEAVVLIVFNGKMGSGFSVQMVDPMKEEAFARALPEILRHTANEMERDLKRVHHDA